MVHGAGRTILEAIHVSDVGMIERGQRDGFAFKPGQSLRIGSHLRRQNLDRDVAPKLGIERAVDLAHAALSKGRHDLVRADPIACTEGH